MEDGCYGHEQWRICLHETAPPIGIFKDLKALLVKLHKAGFVHGDVRDTNIIVRKDGKPGFMLLDFDWSRLLGEARYPKNVFKSKDIWWPEAPSDGELIKPEHDWRC